MGRAHSDTASAEDGFTLVEVVITVGLLSIAFVAILTALGGLIASGVSNRNAAMVQTAVRDAASYIQSFDSTPYVPCTQGAPQPTPQQAYQLDLVGANIPNSLSPTIVSVQYWNGVTPAVFAACPGTDQGLERITVSVSVTSGPGLGGTFSQSLTVLKRGTP